MAISIGTAIGSGFSLVGRRPLSAIGWGFFSYFATIVLTVIGIAIVGFPVLAKLTALGGVAPDPQEALQLGLTMLLALLPAIAIVFIGSLFINAMVIGAVCRSV